MSIVGYNTVAYNLFGIERLTKRILLNILFVDLVAMSIGYYSYAIGGIILLIGHVIIVKSLGFKISTSIIGNIIVVLILFLIDSIVYSIPIFPYNHNIVNQNAVLMPIQLFPLMTSNALYLFVSYGIRVLILKRKNCLFIINHSRFQILGLGFGVGVYTLFYYLIFGTGIRQELKWINTGIFTVTFITFMVILFLMHNASVHAEKATRKEMELIQLATYTESLEYIYTDMRKVRHDFTNVLSSMVGFLDSRDMDGLIAYFSRDVVSFSSQVNQINLNLGLLGNIEQSEIKGLLALKVLKAEELGVEVKLDITERVIFKDVKTLDLCRVIGILMDNAIEAAIASETPSISVGLLNKSHGQIIVINNSHSEEIASIAKLFEKGYSTKGEGRGFGLSNIREIVNRYQKWSLDTEFSDVMFTQVIELER